MRIGALFLALSAQSLCLVFLSIAQACPEALTSKELSFVNSSRSEQIETILASPPEEQVALYILSYRRVAPPNIAAKHAVAELGTAVLPAVLKRMQEEAEDSSKTALVDLLIAMQIQKSYCVACDSETMEIVTASVKSIQNEDYRVQYQNLVSYFLTDPARRQVPR